MRVIVIPGVVAGAALGLVFMLMNASAGNFAYATREVLGLLAILIAVVAAQVLVLRRHPLGHDAPFAARYFTAMLAGVAAALTYGLLAWLYFAFIDPDYLARFHAEYLARAEATGDPAFVRNAENVKSFVVDPLSQAVVQFGTALLIAVLAALATTAFMQRSRRD